MIDTVVESLVKLTLSWHPVLDECHVCWCYHVPAIELILDEARFEVQGMDSIPLHHRARLRDFESDHLSLALKENVLILNEIDVAKRISIKLRHRSLDVSTMIPYLLTSYSVHLSAEDGRVTPEQCVRQMSHAIPVRVF